MRVVLYSASGSMGKKVTNDYSFTPIAHSIPGHELAEIEVEVPEGWTVDAERDRLVRNMPSGNMEARRGYALASSQSEGFRLVSPPAADASGVS